MRSGIICLRIGLLALAATLAQACAPLPARRPVTRSEAESDPLRCALYVARGLGENEPWLLEKVVRAFAAAGRGGEAREIAASMPVPGLFRSRGRIARLHKAGALAAVARCSELPRGVRLALASQALDLASDMDPYWNEPLAEEIAADFELLGEPERAEAAVALRPKAVGRAAALLEVAVELRKAGDPDRAGALLRRARAAVGSIEDRSLRVGHRLAVAEALAAQGDRDGALELVAIAYDDALPPDEDLPGLYLDERLQAVAETYARLGDVDRALAVADSVRTGYKRDAALAEISAATARAGRFDDALALLARVDDENARDGAYVEICGLLAERGDAARALEVAHEVSYPSQRSRATVDAAAALARAGREAAARSELDALAPAPRRPVPDGAILEAEVFLAVGYARVGDVERAREILRRAGAEPYGGSVLTDEAKTLAEHGRADLAVEAVSAIATPTYVDDEGEITVREFRATGYVEVALGLPYPVDAGTARVLREIVAAADR